MGVTLKTYSPKQYFCFQDWKSEQTQTHPHNHRSAFIKGFVERATALYVRIF